MTLQQISQLKRWLVAHRQRSPLEYHCFDAVLTVWLMGWMGMPTALLLWEPEAVILAVLACFAPSFYMRWRSSLHRRRRLRCDWVEPLVGRVALEPLRPKVD